jgi:hypothetical protein
MTAPPIETTARETTPEAPADGGFDYVDTSPSTAIERASSPGDQTVIAAADAALAMPGVPGRDEFLSLAMQARMLSMSGAAPPAVRNSPYVAFHVAMVGRDLGISPSAALELIDVIDGRNGPQLSLSPQLMNGQVRRLGLGEIVKGESTAERCTAIAVGPGGRDRRCRLQWPTHVPDCSCDVLGSFTFTWEDARIAGLVGPNCQPGQHVKDQNRSSNGRSWKVCGCNQGYVTYPQRMLWWRASGYLADDTFPEAGLGLYSPEELGAVVDEDGRPLDVASVELPAGYEPAAVGRGSGEAEVPADPADLWKLQARLHALPDEQKQAWREAKARSHALQGAHSHELSATQLRAARSIVAGLERDAAKSGAWDESSPDEAALEAFGRLVAVIVPTGEEARLQAEAAKMATEHEAGLADAPGTGPEIADTDRPVAGTVPEADDAGGDDRAADPAPPAEAAVPPMDPAVTEAIAKAEAGRIEAKRAAAEVVVKKLSVAKVRETLAGHGQPGDGTAAEVRDRLVAHMVADAIREQNS